eukprot:SAG31_NODE_903_length_11121_cov_10.117311_3_plen_433_part_00
MIHYDRLRILAGGLCWFSGVVNMGIFPGVGTRFFINFCELPTVLFGGAVDSFPIVMFFALSVSVYFTISGGQVAVIVTDFAQGFFCAIFFVVVCVYLGMSTSWQQAADSLQAASLPGKSLFDAFDIGEAASFNGFYYLSGLLLTVYGTQSWQGDAGYNAAAITPHAAQMAGIIGRLRGQLQQLALTLLPMAAIVLLNAPAGTIAGNAAAMASDAVGSELQTRYPGNHALQEQQRVPTALKVVLPPGLRGGFAAAMLGFFISTHTTYLQAWGSILVQDVLIPTFGPQSKATHLRWLRRSVILVAALIFLWSWLMPTRDYILMVRSLPPLHYCSIHPSLRLDCAVFCIIGCDLECWSWILHCWRSILAAWHCSWGDGGAGDGSNDFAGSAGGPNCSRHRSFHVERTRDTVLFVLSLPDDLCRWLTSLRSRPSRC